MVCEQLKDEKKRELLGAAGGEIDLAVDKFQGRKLE